MSEGSEKYREKFHSLNKLVRAVCHHGKGIVTALEGGLYLINSGMEKSDPERIQQGKAMLDRSLLRFVHLISRILYWGAEREFTPVEMNPIETAQEIIAAFRELSAQADVTLNCTFGETGYMRAEPHAISALIADLIDAHLEMCRGSTQKGRSIDFTVERQGDKISFIVSDDSGFLSEEDIKVLMNPSFASQGKEILELNYYIIKRITERHGGTLAVQISDDGKARSIVTIPVND